MSAGVLRGANHLDVRQSTGLKENMQWLTDGILRIRRRRSLVRWSSRNSHWRFGHHRSQDPILVPWFASPHLTIPIAKIMSAFICIVTYPSKTFREPVFILGNITHQVARKSKSR